VADAYALLTSAVSPRLSIVDIRETVSWYFRVSGMELLGRDRSRTIALARHVAMYLARKRLEYSFPEIGRAFGRRDHTTVLSAVRRIERLADTRESIRGMLQQLDARLSEVEASNG